MNNAEIGKAMVIKLDPVLPEYPTFKEGVRRAPKRELTLNKREIKLAVANALRYVPEELHEQLAPEFLDELLTRGRIYGYRFMPKERIYGRPIDEYKGKCVDGKAFQVMIDNNLDHDVALYPYELVTYGETGQVCQNWMQYQLIKRYLEELTDEHTLVMMSGHPMGLFKSHKTSPRVIVTNGLMVGMFDNPEDWAKATAMGVSSYGQMTAGGWMYIGPQGIVHGTFNTILNAGRKFLGVPQDGDLAGHLFVTSGLGGMSGAQPKAIEIARGVGIVAEVDASRIETRHSQGWVSLVIEDAAEAFRVAEEYMEKKETVSLSLIHISPPNTMKEKITLVIMMVVVFVMFFGPVTFTEISPVKGIILSAFPALTISWGWMVLLRSLFRKREFCKNPEPKAKKGEKRHECQYHCKKR